MAERVIRIGRRPVEGVDEDQPCYVISVAARMIGVHAQTLRYYERVGLIEPARSQGNIRMYSPRDVEHGRWIRSLIDDLGINLAGVEVIKRMSARMAQLEQQVQELSGLLYGSPRTAARQRSV